MTFEDGEGIVAPTPAVLEPGDLLRDYLDSQRRVFPAHVNRASQIGHPCERNLVYHRTAWKQAMPPDIRLQGIFLFGRDYENALKLRLQQAGYLMRQPHRPEIWEQFQLSGTDDGDLSWDGGATWKLMEIKGLHTFYFDRVTTWRDFLEMGPIYAKYPAQLQIYMLLLGESESLFVLGRKGAYDVKFLPVELDYEYAESLLKKCERINAHVAAKTLPDKIEDPTVCDICEFREHCLPDVFYGDGARMLDTPEFAALLEQREAAAAAQAAAKKAYEPLQQQIKRIVGDRSVVLAGDFQLRQTVSKKTGVATLRIKRLRAGVQAADDVETDSSPE